MTPISEIKKKRFTNLRQSALYNIVKELLLHACEFGTFEDDQPKIHQYLSKALNMITINAHFYRTVYLCILDLGGKRITRHGHRRKYYGIKLKENL